MKVLIASASFGRLSEAPIQSLAERGYEVIRNPFARRMTESEIIETAAGCSGILSGLEPLSRDVLRSLPGLRCISRCGSGVDNVDTEAAKELGIIVRTTPTAPVRAVAELTIGLVLDLLRGISRHDRGLRCGHWSKDPGRLLRGRDVGVAGLGHIGREVAILLRALGATVRGSDLDPDPDWAEKLGVELLPLGPLLERSEILTIHVSRHPNEPPLIGSAEIARMRHGAFLLNLARGEVIDEAALFEALVSGRLAGAALDVFTSEPYRGPLLKLENVILTPHIGSSTRETIENMETEAVHNLLQTLEGKVRP